MYKIWCKQRNCYFADDTEFENLVDCRTQLIDYHSIDNDEDELKKKSLSDLCDVFDWEIHDNEGQEVDYQILEKIK